VVHLVDFNRSLSESSTPDWVLYCEAARAGFNALVTRDEAQLNQLVEMYVLSRLPGFAVITWKKPIEDPIREWGQLLAYLPEVKKRLRNAGGRERPMAILLPAPTLTEQNLRRPTDTIGLAAGRRGISQHQARADAVSEIRDWLQMTTRDPHQFDELLGL